MKKYLLLLLFVFTSLCLCGTFAADLPISGAGTKTADGNSISPQPYIYSVYPNCYWNGESWVCKQKSKVNFIRKNQKKSQSDYNYTDYIGNEKIYIQNGTIYNISPNCYYDGISWICSHKSKTEYSHKNGKNNSK